MKIMLTLHRTNKLLWSQPGYIHNDIKFKYKIAIDSFTLRVYKDITVTYYTFSSQVCLLLVTPSYKCPSILSCLLLGLGSKFTAIESRQRCEMTGGWQGRNVHPGRSRSLFTTSLKTTNTLNTEGLIVSV